MTIRNIDDGGPAYPVGGFCVDANGALCGETVKSSGMSIRDAFAMAAMQGMLAYPGDEASGSWHSNATVHSVADHAYRIADAMLAAREVKP